MLNLNKCTKNEPKSKPTVIFYKFSSCVCVSLCTNVVHNTTQHRTVLTIFPLILQTIIIAQMMSTVGEEESIP